MMVGRERDCSFSFYFIFISTWRWGERCGRGGREGGSMEKWEDEIKKIVRDERDEREGMERWDGERNEMEIKGERWSAGGEKGDEKTERRVSFNYVIKLKRMERVKWLKDKNDDKSEGRMWGWNHGDKKISSFFFYTLIPQYSSSM
jgi:hypothetical protein